MKKLVPILLFFCFITISGCSNNEVKKQPISGSYAPKDKVDIHNTNKQANINVSSKPINTNSLQELFNQLYLTKAQEDAIEIDIENLEMSLRTGKITQEDFDTKISELKKEENSLDLEKTSLKKQISDLGWDYENPDLNDEQEKLPNDTTKLIRLLENYELLDDDYDMQEDTLETDYQLGNITREDFITKKAKLEQEADLNDRKKDQVEHILEVLGWDD